MKKTNSFSIRARGGSFKHAFDGIKNFFRNEHNTWIHLFATIAVFVLSLITGVTRSESIALILAIGFVWAAELFNTAIEKIMDHLAPEQHPRVQFIKDVAAGAVLIAALTAVLTGLIIFLPKIL